MKTLGLMIATAVLTAIVFRWMPAAQPAGDEVGLEAVSDELAAAPAITRRLQTLEEQLLEEAAARDNLEAMLERLLQSQDLDARQAVSAAATSIEQSEDGEGETEDESRDRRRVDPEQRQIARLQASGFAAGQAEWIVQREKEIRLEQLQTRWQQRRDAYLTDPSGNDLYERSPLRADLGDQAYERYLEASGRSTSVGVARLIENSPAALAGLRAGDQIVSYDGRRVFDLRDLNAVSVQGDAGEVVLVDVVRDGNRIQLAVERGPLGIISRRDWR